jgi:superfamily I DNA/RNA helicase
MNLYLDTETSGLPARNANYKNPSDFDGSRLVSICWMISQGDNLVEQHYYIVKPQGFIISDESIAIHGITNEYAKDNGDNVNNILEELGKSISKCTNLVAHNMKFDINIIKSELFRIGRLDIINDITKNRHLICTMEKGRLFMKVRKFPKLSELYKFLYNEELTNAHCALDDTKHCYKCYIKLFPSDPGIFYFGDKQIKLTEEQKKVTFEEINKNMLIVASAGSGKTTTIITRIKYLIDSGVPESSIILTTFTRNAANDMKEKLFEIMGYKSDIVVGTIDSISKYYIELNKEKNIIEEISIDQYAPKFLEMIQSRVSFFSNFKYLIVDEIQDINEIQFNIINEFYKNNVNIIGVGDDSQNIYEFRGSNIKYILNFSKLFNNSIVHMLTHNFRSTKEIVALANSSIDRNKNKIPKIMIASNELLNNSINNKPVIKFFQNDNKQYIHVLLKIKKLLENNVKEDSICIMSPTNKPLEDIYNLLCENNIASHYSRSYSETYDNHKKTGHVNLNTIHRAKGLEFPIVFLISMNDQSNKRDEQNKKTEINKKNRIESNRRLFYVAVTRAIKELYIYTNCPDDITRFVTELDPELFKY